MLRFLLVAAAAFLSAAAPAQTLPAAARGVLGDWTIVDETTGEAQAVVHVVDVRGVVEGRIIRVLPTRRYPAPSNVCANCRGAFRGVDLRTVRLIREMNWDGGRFTGGRIVDPENDRTYRATMALDGPTRLRVRGYVGIPALGRTQVWTRAR